MSGSRKYPKISLNLKKFSFKELEFSYSNDSKVFTIDHKDSILISHQRLFNRNSDFEQFFYLYFFKIISKYFKNIYVKTHPQYNYPKYLDNFKLIKIEKTIPIELINTKNCKFIIGISGASMLLNTQGLVVSLIKLIYKKNSEDFIYQIEQLNQNKMILFPESFEELNNILKKSLK